MKYRLKQVEVIAVRWHGKLGKPDSFAEIEEAFDVAQRQGQIGMMLGGAICVPSAPGKGVSVKPGQWLIRGIKDEFIVMEDELFQALFEGSDASCGEAVVGGVG